MFEGFLADGNRLRETAPLVPARIPPPAQIALLSTLTIHPFYTSRAPERANLHIATQSSAYLESLLAIVGPVNANLRAALKFSGGDRSKGRGKTYSSSSDPDSDSDYVDVKYATTSSTSNGAGMRRHTETPSPRRPRSWAHVAICFVLWRI